MKLDKANFLTEHLDVHLQAAVDLELWTIPFYMSAMYSVKDRTSQAYQLIRTVLNQEMLHLQSAANIANAYGLSPSISPPVYEGQKIPHLDFKLDPPESTEAYYPYTAEIGPLDEKHINAMCLVEIPEFGVSKKDIILHSKTDEYGSIGEFYEALRFGASHLKNHIRGGVKQVDLFSAFYRNMPNMVISESKDKGFNQVDLLIDLITNQGEGQSYTDSTVPASFQNTADDIQPSEDHFTKFNEVKDNELPETYIAKPPKEYTNKDKELEQILIKQFAQLTMLLEGLFNGENPEDFFPLMASVGGAIRNCWEHGVTPKFSETTEH